MGQEIPLTDLKAFTLKNGKEAFYYRKGFYCIVYVAEEDINQPLNPEDILPPNLQIDTRENWTICSMDLFVGLRITIPILGWKPSGYRKIY
jgi:hypothetical protein